MSAMNDIRYYRQEKPYTCGPACLRMLLSSYGDFSESLLATLAGTIIGGTTPLGLARAARQVGYDAKVIRHADMEDLKANVPSIVLINPGILLGSRSSISGHFLVVKEVKSDSLIVNDPMPFFGGENRRFSLEIFLAAWEIMDSWLISIGSEKNGKDSSD